MDEKKHPLGFPTSAQEMQEALEEIKERLEKDRVNWLEIRQSSKQQVLKFLGITEESLKATENVVSVGSSNTVVFHGLMMAIAKLGEELATTHQRLASVEKSITELNRRIK